MATVSQIEKAILELEGGAYQNLMNAYLYRKYNFKNITPLGSQVGTNKTTKGIPDAYVRKNDGSYVYIMYGTVGPKNVFRKLKADVKSIVNNKKSTIPLHRVSKLICCHTTHTITPEQDDELHNLFPRLELIGIATLAQEIFCYHQDLAHDFLNLCIDSGQILPLEAFMKKYNAKAAASLSFKLYGREKELLDLTQLLQAQDILVICGKSGRGKTRLAIEVGKNFATQQQYIFKTVLNNGEQIYEDILSHFPDKSNYLIFIDDANLLTGIHHFLNLVLDPNRKHKTKLIFTVRDYAKANLLSKLKQEQIKIYSYDLQPLAEDIIQKIIKDNFNLRNQALLNRIIRITHDNIRLAIMAARCANNEEWEKIENPSEIFDCYYNNNTHALSLKQLQVAALIAFFQKLKLSPNHLITKFLSKADITYEQFVTIIRELHKQEIIDMLKESAVKFGEQTFGDYLLYRFFIKEPIMPFNELLQGTLPKYQKNVIYLVNIACGIFKQPESNEMISCKLKSYWYSISNHPFEEKLNFIEAFFGLLPTEGLGFIQDTFQTLPNPTPDSAQESTITPNHIDRILPILVSYKYSDNFEAALDILCFYIRYKTNDIEHIYQIIEDSLFIDPYSAANKYKQEITIIKVFEKEFKKTHNRNIGYLLALFANTCLKTQNTCQTYTGKIVEITTIPLTLCPSSIKLRKYAISAFLQTYKMPELQMYIKQRICHYLIALSKDDFFKIDVQHWITFTKSCLSYNRFDDALLLYMFHYDCKKHHIPCLRKFNSFAKNLSCQIFIAMSRRQRENLSNFKESHAKKVKRLQLLTKNLSKDCFRHFFKDLQTSQLASEIDNNYTHFGLQALFEAQVHHLKAFSDIFLAYAETPYKSITPSLDYIIGTAITTIKPMVISQLIDQIAEPQQSIFRSAFYNAIPPQQINKQDIENLFNLLNEKRKNEKIFLLPISNILEINKYHPNFAYNYIQTAYTAFKNTPVLLTHIFRDYIPNEKAEATLLAKCCSPRRDHTTLQNIYILLAANHPYSCFDYYGTLFQAIYHLDGTFVENIIQQALINKEIRREILALFQQIWNLPESTAIIQKAITAIYDNTSSDWEIVFCLSSILFPSSDKNHREQRVKFIQMYIKKYALDIPKMQHLFRAMWNESVNIKQQFMTDFCKENPSYQDLCSIQCRSKSRFWSNSQIPVIEQEIASIRQTIENLKETSYLKHKIDLGKQISELENEKETVLEEEFLDDSI